MSKYSCLTLTSSSVAGSDGGGADIENSGHVDVVPLFLGEGVSAISYNENQACDRKRFASDLRFHYSQGKSGNSQKWTTYIFFFWPFFLKFLGFFPAVILDMMMMFFY